MGRKHARILDQAREGDMTAREAWQRIRDRNEDIDWSLERMLPEVFGETSEQADDDSERPQTPKTGSE